jgi:hypothetical protein
VRSFRTRFYIYIEVLQLLKTEFVYYLAVFARTDHPVAWEVLLKPRGEEVNTVKDNKRWKGLTKRVDCLDYRNPFAVSWL